MRRKQTLTMNGRQAEWMNNACSLLQDLELANNQLLEARRAKLKELYSREMREWRRELAVKGFTFESLAE
jgi:hypothetical protein